MLIKSGQAEILRAFQKDETFISQLQQKFIDLVLDLRGIRGWMKIKHFLKNVPNLLYYSMTTLCNVQTLGEEYTGIFQTHSSGKALQKKHIQVIMILLNTFGEELLMKSLEKLEKYIKNLPADHPLKPKAREKLIQCSISFRKWIPILQSFHKAMFYINGQYYEISKRLTNTRYVLIRHWLKNKSTLPAFRLLGIMSFIQLSLHILMSRGSSVKDPTEDDGADATNDEDVLSCNKCSLCLSTRKNTSSIPCGHLFCWNCIISWLREKPYCPLCRKAAKASRVMFLQNY